MPGSDESKDIHVLDRTETYLFSNCSRHADTGGIILAVPLAVLGKVLAQRRFPAANPYLLGLLAGAPTFLATQFALSSLYFSNVCWGYLKLLPDESVLKRKLDEASERYEARFVTYNRARAFQDVMFWEKQVKVDGSFGISKSASLTREEKHDIQEQLRWVPSEKYQLIKRLREHVAPDPRVEKYLKKMDNIERVVLSDFDPTTKDERLKNAATPLPVKVT